MLTGDRQGRFEGGATPGVPGAFAGRPTCLKDCAREQPRCQVSENVSRLQSAGGRDSQPVPEAQPRRYSAPLPQEPSSRESFPGVPRVRGPRTPYAPRGWERPCFLMRVLAAAAVAAAAGLFAFALFAASHEGATSQEGASDQGFFAPFSQEDGGFSRTSTPRNQWTRGAMPYLYQTDVQWANEPYAGGVIEKTGCGPTCLSMVYVMLTGKTDCDPAAMAVFSESGGYVVDGMTSWDFMTDGAARFGLVAEELPATEGVIAGALAEGRPVIVSVGSGDFTSEGHFIALEKLADSGEAVVHDPNSPENSQRTWPIERIIRQARNFWTYEAA